jgi:putative peptidoglycan lipid II flippase
VGRILKKTALISILTFLSRILGVVRDSVIAVCFGASIQSDAFFIAFRPFDLTRKLFSEGILNISLIPVFSETFEKEGKSKAATLVFSFFFFFSIIGILIVLIGILFAPLMIKIIAPGFIDNSYQYGLTMILMKIMLPYVFFILITALCMAVLNSLGNFGIPAVAPLVFNLVVIIFTLFISKHFNMPVIGLAVGVTVGGILQLAIQIPPMIRHGMLKISLSFLFHPGVLRVAKIMVPSMIGAASYQINIMVASFFTSRLDEGSVSFVYYADRLVQFPLSLFAVSVATVLLPEISKKVVIGQLDEVSVLFSWGVKLVFFITIPSMAGLMGLSEPIVKILFGYGAFDASAVQKTSECLFFLAMGLWAFTGMRLFVTLYYSLMQISIPFYSGIITIGLNLILCPVLMSLIGLKGLIFSVSVSAVAGFAFLFFHIPGTMNIRKREIIVSACRSFFVSVIMFFLVRQMAEFVLPLLPSKLGFIMGVAGCIGFGIIFYLGINQIISNPELEVIKARIKGRRHDHG